MTCLEIIKAVPDARIPDAQIPANAWSLETPSAICMDSRLVTTGAIFVCIPGTKIDGRQFAESALAAGALCAVGEGAAPEGVDGERWISTSNARLAYALLAAAFHRHPSHELQVFAVTGTNGKTTTATLLRSVLEECGVPCGLLSTVEQNLGGEILPAERTTPDAGVIQSGLARMVRNKCRAAVLEVSSHALTQHRSDGTLLAGAAFTNLSQDHLDYHGDMDKYAAAKRLLFEQLSANLRGVAVINIDDAEGARINALMRERGMPTITFGFGPEADFRAVGPSLDTRGCNFTLRTAERTYTVNSPLLGRHNIMNLLAAAALATVAGASLDKIVAALERQPPVRGRLERVETPEHSATWFIDYAHTPDALAGAIDTLRPLTKGRLIVVFGCGGDRDRGKRPKMGSIAAQRAEVVVVTSDNPRSEDPDSIIKDILAGAESPDAAILIEPDRHKAIIAAAALASRPEDVVLVAGKGHETTQTFATRTVHFDDREEVSKAIQPRPGTCPFIFPTN